jgi:choline dehydrogenase
MRRNDGGQGAGAIGFGLASLVLLLSGCNLSPTVRRSCSGAGCPRADDVAADCIGPRCATVEEPFDYIVVGSGAGGGPLAARLAQAGKQVLLLEAGDDQGGLLTYQVPAFHTLVTEEESLRWDYLVQHYDNAAQATLDTKMVFTTDDAGNEVPQGILYPRAGTLGGCTAHNAMITVYPDADDWEGIRALTGDPSWGADSMRAYFRRVEDNHYPDTVPVDPAAHGYGGWLRTNLADPGLGLTDRKILRIVAGGAGEFVDAQNTPPVLDLIRDVGQLVGVITHDINGFTPSEGLYSIPLAMYQNPRTRRWERNGVRERIVDTVAAGLPLTVQMHALVTRVTFDGANRATGVEYLWGPSLYRADPRAQRDQPLPEPWSAEVTPVGEVILSAGAFNTPQLLKLSGVGPAAELRALGIDLVQDSPQVGENLQDRYEVGVVFETTTALLGRPAEFSLTKPCTFADGDDTCLDRWRRGEKGVYASNGGIVGIVKKDPDLFIFGLPSDFRGYQPGYARKGLADRFHFTWAILEAHTENRRGNVLLHTEDGISSDPRDPPDIHFHYFDDPRPPDADPALAAVDDAATFHDLGAMVWGVNFVTQLGAKIDGLMHAMLPVPESFNRVWPPANWTERPQIEQWIKNEAWGHHACCTAAIGAVLDGDFRVLGVDGLRVVDASVFPRIPGFFIVVPTYMVSEKAADVILRDAP